jgi:hypothetical protein
MRSNFWSETPSGSHSEDKVVVGNIIMEPNLGGNIAKLRIGFIWPGIGTIDRLLAPCS